MTSGVARASVADLGVEGAEDALAPVVGVDVDALEPPDPAGPPVAPLAGDGRLADDPARLARPRPPSSGAGRGRPRAAATPRVRTAGSRALPSVSWASRALKSTMTSRSSGRASRIDRGGSGIRSARSAGSGPVGWPRRGPGSRPRSGPPRPSRAILTRISSSFSSNCSSGITAVGAGRVEAAVLGRPGGADRGPGGRSASRGSGETIRSRGVRRNIFSSRESRRSPTLKR